MRCFLSTGQYHNVRLKPQLYWLIPIGRAKLSTDMIILLSDARQRKKEATRTDSLSPTILTNQCFFAPSLFISHPEDFVNSNLKNRPHNMPATINEAVRLSDKFAKSTNMKTIAHINPSIIKFSNVIFICLI
jgi:hypothetical protein